LATSKEGGIIYLLTNNGEKWPISNQDHFDKYGFDDSKIAHFDPAELSLFKTGRTI
jgi:hypothetical protein